jgi:YD repeat-containing protein
MLITKSNLEPYPDSDNLLPARESLNIGELTTLETKAGTTSLIGMTFERDKLGRITKKVEVIQVVTHTYQYSYDAAGRLVQVLQDGQSAEQYSYGTNGSRTSGPNVSQTSYDGQNAWKKVQNTGVYLPILTTLRNWPCENILRIQGRILGMVQSIAVRLLQEHLEPLWDKSRLAMEIVLQR